MTLGMTYSDLMRKLAEVENQCRVITDAAHGFENLIKSNELIIKLKLEILRFWVVASEGELYLNHQGKGYVYACVTEQNGISIQWYDANEGFVKEALHKYWGQTIFSINEVNDTIVKFEQEVSEGDSVKAAAWLNSYGKTAGQDFRKLPPPERLQAVFETMEKLNKHAEEVKQ